MAVQVTEQDGGNAGITNLSLGEGEPSVSVDLVDAKDASGVDAQYLYRMDHKKRGQFIIVNNKVFNPNTGMSERTGTDQDAANLYSLTRKLGFDVTLVHNQTVAQMLQFTLRVSTQDHSECDCFGMAVLSHGDNGILFGVDGTITVDNLVAPIKKCQSLAGKPKIFIFQACRGTDLDEGTNIAHDAQTDPTKTYRIPLEADFLYAYSTVSGYFSWRNSQKGSWFIQAFFDQMQQNMYNLDLVKILTRVNHQVAYKFESNAALEHMTRKKQIPSIVSMLTKDIQFTQKK